MKLSIHGCRGSVPTSSRSIHKYGGNTSCFEIITENNQIIFDAGTGFKNVKFSKSRASFLLLSHFHHDHIQGLPFNPELFDPKNEIIISSGLCDIELVKQTIQKCFSPPYFPFDVVSLLSNIKFLPFNAVQDKLGKAISLGSMLLKHPGGSTGYKLIEKNSSFIYICDNEFDETQRKSLVNFSKNADLLIWDGMFTQRELADKKGWGHSSIEQAIDFNSGANCKKILIAHHAPSRSDKELDQIAKDLPELFILARDGLEMGSKMQKMELNAGNTIFKKGDPADGLYIVGKGSVGIYFPTNQTMEKPDIVLKANEILGEMGVIDMAPRMATAKALEESVIIFVSIKEFEKKLEDSDMIIRGVMAILSERLREIQKRR